MAAGATLPPAPKMIKRTLSSDGRPRHVLVWPELDLVAFAKSESVSVWRGNGHIKQVCDPDPEVCRDALDHLVELDADWRFSNLANLLWSLRNSGLNVLYRSERDRSPLELAPLWNDGILKLHAVRALEAEWCGSDAGCTGDHVWLRLSGPNELDGTRGDFIYHLNRGTWDVLPPTPRIAYRLLRSAT